MLEEHHGYVQGNNFTEYNSGQKDPYHDTDTVIEYSYEHGECSNHY